MNRDVKEITDKSHGLLEKCNTDKGPTTKGLEESVSLACLTNSTEASIIRV